MMKLLEKLSRVNFLQFILLLVLYVCIHFFFFAAVPAEYHNKIAQFLEGQGLKELALEVPVSD